MPAPLSEAARRIRGWLDERHVASRWLRMVTGGSFLRVPQPREGESITSADTILRLGANPMAWIRGRDSELEVSVNGLSTTAPADPLIEGLLGSLDDAGPMPVTALLRPFAERGGAEAERLVDAASTLLTELWKFRGIERVDQQLLQTPSGRPGINLSANAPR